MEECITPFIENSLADDEKALKAKELITTLLRSVAAEVIKIDKRDWFYAVEVNGCKLFVCQNETGKYTVMIPSDY